MPAIEKFMRILATTVPAFLPREKPISRNAKPACMNITRQAATTTHIELIPTDSGSTPLPAASNVSAIAAAGATSTASNPSPIPRAVDERVIDPPVSSATASLRAGREGVFRLMSKDRRGLFARRSSAAGRRLHQGERSSAILRRLDKVGPPPPA